MAGKRRGGWTTTLDPVVSACGSIGDPFEAIVVFVRVEHGRALRPTRRRDRLRHATLRSRQRRRDMVSFKDDT